MAVTAKVSVSPTFSSDTIERDFLRIQTSWQGDRTVAFYIDKESRKAFALKPSEVRPGRFDIVAEAWMTSTEVVKKRRSRRLINLAKDALPVVEGVLVQRFAPEPAQCAVAL